MPWVKLDEMFPDHKKLARCGDLAPLCGWLYVCGLAFCNRQLTDGHIPKPHIHKLVNFRHIQAGGVDVDVDKLAAKLVAKQLWEETEDEYIVHDYLKYQPSRADVLAERERLKEIGRKGGTSRAKRKLEAEQAAQLEAKLAAEQKAKLELKPVPVPEGTTPSNPPPDCEALWEAWREVANTHGAKFPVTPPAKDIERLLELGRTYTADDIRRAAQAFWSKDAKARSLAYFAPQVGELLAPTVLSPEDEWRKGFFHFWTCRECGEVHSTDEREVYQRKPCQKEHGTMSYAEFKARQAAKGAA